MIIPKNQVLKNRHKKKGHYVPFCQIFKDFDYLNSLKSNVLTPSTVIRP